MKPEDHIHFLSDLIYQLEELQGIVKDYCKLMSPEPDDPSLEALYDKDNGPF